jgi:hypothetical protein
MLAAVQNDAEQSDINFKDWGVAAILKCAPARIEWCLQYQDALLIEVNSAINPRLAEGLNIESTASAQSNSIWQRSIPHLSLQLLKAQRRQTMTLRSSLI